LTAHVGNTRGTLSSVHAASTYPQSLAFGTISLTTPNEVASCLDNALRRSSTRRKLSTFTDHSGCRFTRIRIRARFCPWGTTLSLPTTESTTQPCQPTESLVLLLSANETRRGRFIDERLTNALTIAYRLLFCQKRQRQTRGPRDVLANMIQRASAEDAHSYDHQPGLQRASDAE
jgi:hypothetical protein